MQWAGGTRSGTFFATADARDSTAAARSARRTMAWQVALSKSYTDAASLGQAEDWWALASALGGRGRDAPRAPPSPPPRPRAGTAVLDVSDASGDSDDDGGSLPSLRGLRTGALRPATPAPTPASRAPPASTASLGSDVHEAAMTPPRVVHTTTHKVDAKGKSRAYKRCGYPQCADKPPMYTGNFSRHLKTVHADGMLGFDPGRPGGGGFLPKLVFFSVSFSFFFLFLCYRRSCGGG